MRSERRRTRCRLGPELCLGELPRRNHASFGLSNMKKLPVLCAERVRAERNSGRDASPRLPVLTGLGRARCIRHWGFPSGAVSRPSGRFDASRLSVWELVSSAMSRETPLCDEVVGLHLPLRDPGAKGGELDPVEKGVCTAVLEVRVSLTGVWARAKRACSPLPGRGCRWFGSFKRGQSNA